MTPEFNWFVSTLIQLKLMINSFKCQTISASQRLFQRKIWTLCWGLWLLLLLFYCVTCRQGSISIRMSETLTCHDIQILNEPLPWLWRTSNELFSTFLHVRQWNKVVLSVLIPIWIVRTFKTLYRCWNIQFQMEINQFLETHTSK